MTCEHAEHMLVERAEGLLDERALAQLETHLVSCEACRAAAAEFSEISGRLASAGAAFGAVTLRAPVESPAAAKTAAKTTVHAPDQAGRARSASSRVRRVVRWAAPLAAAAGLAAALLFPLGVFDRKAGSAEAATALSAMSRAMDNERRVSVEIAIMLDGESTAPTSGRLVMVDLRYRVEMPDGRVIISDTQSGRTQIQLPNEKKFIEAPKREATPIDLYETLVKLAENPSQDLGIEVLEGVPARVFTVRGVNGPLDVNDYKVWINPYTSLPMKVEMAQAQEVTLNGGRLGRLVLTQFLWGNDVTAQVSFAPPTGFTEAPITADPKAAQMEVQVAARNIVMGTMVSQQMHGEWPQRLQQLVDDGQLTIQQARNVRAAPDAPNYGWIFIPQVNADYDPNRVVVTEPAPEPWTEVVMAFADGHAEIVNDRERYERLLAGSGVVVGGVVVDPTQSAGEGTPRFVAASDRLPLAILNLDDLQGLQVEGNLIASGDARFEASRLRECRYLPRELVVNRFVVPDGATIVTVNVGAENPTFGLQSPVAASINRGSPPVLIDGAGGRYPAIGYVYVSQGEYRVRYFPDDPIDSLDEIPAPAQSELVLIFAPRQGVDIIRFAIGDRTLARFMPALTTAP